MKHFLVVLGSGESGVGAAMLGKQKGYDVFVSDAGNIAARYKKELIDNGIEFEEGQHTAARILTATEVMKSPGIPEKNEMVKQIRANGIPVISEIELAFRFKGESKIVAITGSNGKSTTTALMYHICKTAGLDCAMVGNIGYSFAKQIAEAPKALYVAEISSFQLDDIKTFRPDVSVLLNITEDHLDRYNYQFENYIKSKFKIIENQTDQDFFIYCADDDIITDWQRTGQILGFDDWTSDSDKHYLGYGPVWDKVINKKEVLDWVQELQINYQFQYYEYLQCLNWHLILML